jgi:SAM-dependent methyltransferase/uncharacterized protein YbaR (Trm112 family)
MALDLDDILRCPACGGRLQASTDAGRAADSVVPCTGCQRPYPVRNGVLRMADPPVGAEDAASTFGFQWLARSQGRFEQDTLYGLTREQEERAFCEAYDLAPEQLRGKRILDAGCGDGFLLETLADHGPELVGMDVNTAIEVAHRRCSALPNVAVVQADIMKPCFAPASFDLVWCEGVIVHTPDPRRAFRSVSRLVRPGGQLYVWVYPAAPRSVYQRVRDLLVRAYKLPRPALFALCRVLALALTPALQLSGRRRSLRTVTFDLYDNLSPRYQWRFTEAEIRRYFEEDGFGQLRVRGRFGVSGTRSMAR